METVNVCSFVILSSYRAYKHAIRNNHCRCWFVFDKNTIEKQPLKALSIEREIGFHMISIVLCPILLQNFALDINFGHNLKQ